MLIGICFLIVGVIIYANENYSIITTNGERIVEKKERLDKNRVYRYKIMVSIFSLILGVFRILSSIIY